LTQLPVLRNLDEGGSYGPLNDVPERAIDESIDSGKVQDTKNTRLRIYLQALNLLKGNDSGTDRKAQPVSPNVKILNRCLSLLLKPLSLTGVKDSDDF